ncbi:Stearoyl-CoA desaturase 5 [Halotydeus destructor]|nr:Stearoyl-CoA desaturase 5 [Halotydeus destructor]
MCRKAAVPQLTSNSYSDMSFVKVNAKGSQETNHDYHFIQDGAMDIVWTNVAIFVTFHILAVYTIYKVLVMDVSWQTIIFLNFLVFYAELSTTAGSHRLWAHKTYKASLPLKMFLLIGQTIAGQNSVYVWARDHRVHHKWSDTDADPHNSQRGFFFTHCGWLMTKKHPEMMVKSRTLNFSDLDNDQLLSFQRKYYVPLYLSMTIVIPSAIPVIMWNESIWISYLSVYVLRYVVNLHITWFVNSAAHMFGDRPYDDKMAPAENPWVSIVTHGEGYHNFHHKFPSDYQASEHGHGFNLTTHFINLMAKLGQAHDLKRVSDTVVMSCKSNTVNNNNFRDSLKSL